MTVGFGVVGGAQQRIKMSSFNSEIFLFFWWPQHYTSTGAKADFLESDGVHQLSFDMALKKAYQMHQMWPKSPFLVSAAC